MLETHIQETEDLTKKTKLPIHSAVEKNYSDEAPDAVVLRAAELGYGIDTIRLLKMEGYNLSYVDSEGNSLLHMAVVYENWQLVYDLINVKELDIFKENNEGKNFLVMAEEKQKMFNLSDVFAQRILWDIKNPFVRYFLRRSPNFSAVNLDKAWLDNLNFLLEQDVIAEEALSINLQRAGFSLTNEQIRALIEEVKDENENPKKPIVDEFTNLPLSVLDDMLQDLKDFLKAYKCDLLLQYEDKTLGNIDPQMNLYDAICASYATMVDSLGQPITTNHNQALATAVSRFMNANANTPTEPFKGINKAANLIAAIHRVKNQYLTICNACHALPTVDQAYDVLQTHQTQSMDDYSKNALNSELEKVLQLSTNSDLQIEPDAIQQMQAALYKLNVLTLNIQKDNPKPQKRAVLRDGNQSLTLSDIIETFKDDSDAELLDLRLKKISELPPEQQAVIDKLIQLSEQLTQNRIDTFPNLSDQLSHGNLFISSSRYLNEQDLAEYYRKHIPFFTSETFFQLMQQRATIAEEMMQLISENKDLKVSLPTINSEGDPIEVKATLDKLFIQDLSINDPRMGSPMVLNVFKYLQRQHLNSNLAVNYSYEAIIEETIADIRKGLDTINVIRYDSYNENQTLANFILHENSVVGGRENKSAILELKALLEGLPRDKDQLRRLLKVEGLSTSISNVGNLFKAITELRKLGVLLESKDLPTNSSLDLEMVLAKLSNTQNPAIFTGICKYLSKLNKTKELNRQPLLESFNLLSELEEQLNQVVTPDNIQTQIQLAEHYSNLLACIESRLEKTKCIANTLTEKIKLFETLKQKGVAELGYYEQQIALLHIAIEKLQVQELGGDLQNLTAEQQRLFYGQVERVENQKEYISSKLLELQRIKSSFSDEKSRMESYLLAMRAKLLAGSFTFNDYLKFISNSENQSVLQQDTELAQQFKVLHRQFIIQDAAAVVKRSRELFQELSKEDLLAGRFDRKKHPDSTIFKITDFFNNLSQYVQSDILSYDNVTQRMLALEHWVNVALSALNVYGDVNIAMAMHATFNSTALSRLKATWESMPENLNAKFQTLAEACDTSRSYKALRESFHTQRQAAIPYVGVLNSDITFTIDGNSFLSDLPQDVNPTAESPEAFLASNVENYSHGGLKCAVLFDVVQTALEEEETLGEFNSNLYTTFSELNGYESKEHELFARSQELEPQGTNSPTSDFFEKFPVESTELEFLEDDEDPSTPTMAERIGARYKILAERYFLVDLPILKLQLPILEHMPLEDLLQDEKLFNLHHRKLGALYDSWADYVGENNEDDVFQRLKQWNVAMGSFYKVLQSHEALSKAQEEPIDDQILYRIKMDALQARENLAELSANADEDFVEFYNQIEYRIISLEERLLPYSSQISEVKVRSDTAFQQLLALQEMDITALKKGHDLNELNETICQKMDAFSKSLFTIDGIIQEKPSFFRHLTDKQEVLLDTGKLVLFLDTNHRNLGVSVSRVTEAEFALLALEESLQSHISDEEIRNTLNNEYQADLIIKRRQAIREFIQEQKHIISQLDTNLKNAYTGIQEKFKWVYAEFSRKSQLLVVERFIHQAKGSEINFSALMQSTQVGVMTKADIGDVRQAIADLSQLLEQINIYQLSIANNVQQLPQSAQVEYQKNKSLIDTILSNLTSLEQSLLSLRSQLEAKLEDFGKKMAAASSTISSPAQTAPVTVETKVTHKDAGPQLFQQRVSLPAVRVEPSTRTPMSNSSTASTKKYSKHIEMQSFVPADDDFDDENMPLLASVDMPLISNHGRGTVLDYVVKPSGEMIFNPNQKDSQADKNASVEHMLRKNIDPQQKAYEVEGKDKALMKKTCVWLKTLGKIPLIQNQQGRWVEYSFSLAEKLEIKSKQHELRKQEAPSKDSVFQRLRLN